MNKPTKPINAIIIRIAIPLLSPLLFKSLSTGETKIEIKIANRKGTKIGAAIFKPETTIVNEAPTIKYFDNLE